MTKLNPKIFRGFSIRGIVGEDFDLNGMRQMAHGVGEWFKKNSHSNLVVGHDVRISSVELHSILCDELLNIGLDVIDIGLVPTPLLNFATDYYQASGGVMVTASHNPPQYNGLKIRSDRTVYGEDLQKIFALTTITESIIKKGQCIKESPLVLYTDALMERAKISRPLRVIVDGGNGANGKVVPSILRKLGLDVHEIFCDLDGTFPNRDPDPTAPKATNALQQKVLESKADIGLAFDGDGDRVIAVDEIGQTIMGDYLLMLLAGEGIKNSLTNKMVYEVLCTHAVPDYVASLGGKAFPAASGYAFVHDVMISSGAQIGGEMSGHFFLLDNVFRFDDAILASIKLLSLLSSESRPLSSLISDLPHYFASPEYRLDCPDDRKANIVNQMREEYSRDGFSLEEIDGVSVNFGGTWALIRQSNTQPKISLRFESQKSEDEMIKAKLDFIGRLKKIYQTNVLSFPEID